MAHVTSPMKLLAHVCIHVFIPDSAPFISMWKQSCERLISHCGCNITVQVQAWARIYTHVYSNPACLGGRCLWREVISSQTLGRTKPFPNITNPLQCPAEGRFAGWLDISWPGVSASLRVVMVRSNSSASFWWTGCQADRCFREHFDRML